MAPALAEGEAHQALNWFRATAAASGLVSPERSCSGTQWSMRHCSQVKELE